jgi:hypothetical protein
MILRKGKLIWNLIFLNLTCHLEEGCYRYSVIGNGFKGEHVEVGYLLTDGLEQGSWNVRVLDKTVGRLRERYTLSLALESR